MQDNNFLPLDPLLNNELRLAIISILMSADTVDILFMGISVAIAGLVINRLFISVIDVLACIICAYFALIYPGINELFCTALLLCSHY